MEETLPEMNLNDEFEWKYDKWNYKKWFYSFRDDLRKYWKEIWMICINNCLSITVHRDSFVILDGIYGYYKDEEGDYYGEYDCCGEDGINIITLIKDFCFSYESWRKKLFGENNSDIENTMLDLINNNCNKKLIK